MSALKIGKYYITKNDPRFLLRKVAELTDENQKYKELIDKVIDLLDNHQNNLYSKQARETLDDDIELVLKLLKKVE